MTKTELQSALAEATQTDKRTAGVFLDTLGALAYKEIKKNGEFVLPGFGKLVKQKRKARTGFNPKDATEDQDSSQDRRQISWKPLPFSLKKSLKTTRAPSYETPDDTSPIPLSAACNDRHLIFESEAG